MKKTLKLNLKQQSQVIEAMETYKRALRGINQKRFLLILEKVKSGETQFDSEEMIYMVQALRSYSKIQYIYQEDTTSHELRTLADRIEKARINFQAKHNPLNRLIANAQ